MIWRKPIAQRPERVCLLLTWLLFAWEHHRLRQSRRRENSPLQHSRLTSTVRRRANLFFPLTICSFLCYFHTSPLHQSLVKWSCSIAQDGSWQEEEEDAELNRGTSKRSTWSKQFVKTAWNSFKRMWNCIVFAKLWCVLFLAAPECAQSGQIAMVSQCHQRSAFLSSVASSFPLVLPLGPGVKSIWD